MQARMIFFASKDNFFATASNDNFFLQARIILLASKEDAFDQRASHLANVGLGNLRKDVLEQKCHLIILIYNLISGVIKNGLFTVRPRSALM